MQRNMDGIMLKLPCFFFPFTGKKVYSKAISPFPGGGEQAFP